MHSVKIATDATLHASKEVGCKQIVICYPANRNEEHGST
jgi:hypothetical protein